MAVTVPTTTALHTWHTALINKEISDEALDCKSNIEVGRLVVVLNLEMVKLNEVCYGNDGKHCGGLHMYEIPEKPVPADQKTKTAPTCIATAKGYDIIRSPLPAEKASSCKLPFFGTVVTEAVAMLLLKASVQRIGTAHPNHNRSVSCFVVVALCVCCGVLDVFCLL